MVRRELAVRLRREGYEQLKETGSTTLEELLRDNDLYLAYPAFRKMEVRKMPDNEAARGAFDGESIEINMSLSAWEVRDVLRHEIQHAIQQKEGFARGGSPDMFEGKSEMLKPEVESFRKKADASEKYRRKEELDREFGKIFANGTDEEVDVWNEKFGEEYDALEKDPEVQAIDQEKFDILKRYGNNLNVLEVLKEPGNEKAWKSISLDDDSYRLMQYRRLAGEVEARNAVKRAGLSLETRLGMLLADTADVADEDRIFIERRLNEGMRDERGEMREERRGTEEPEETERAYYVIPFSDGLKRVVDPAQKVNRNPVYVRDTPKVFREIGFTALPMIMNARHLRLNYYTAEEFERLYGKIRTQEHAHGLHDVLERLPKALENPLAIVVNRTPNAKPGSVVAITDMDVKGKKIVVPVLIEAISTAADSRIDSHLVLTVYDESDWMNKFLKPALKEEKSGIGIFYFDKEKAARYSALSKKEGSIPTGLVHTIAQAGINVKQQTETLQFKRWFGDSKVVDEDGKPLVVYRRDDEEFTIFDFNKTQKNDAGWLGKGFYFYGDKGEAERAYGYGRNLRSFYLRAENPYYISNEEYNELVNANDSQKSAEFTERLKEEGYDSVYWDGDLRREWVVFEPNQIKSATDNIGTFDRNNPDVRYSVRGGAVAEDEAKVQAWAESLLEVWGTAKCHTVKQAEKYLEQCGIDVGEEDRILLEAACSRVGTLRLEHVKRNAEAKRKASVRAGWEWIYANNDLYREIVDFTGTENFVIRPSFRFQGETFSGSFISPEWVNFSGHSNTEKAQEAMKKASGFHSDEIAEAIARKTGRDPLDVEQEIIDTFGELTKQELYSQYAKFREEEAWADREMMEKARLIDLAREMGREEISEEEAAAYEKGKETAGAESIMAGKAPRTLFLAKLDTNLPFSWQEQLKLFGMA